MTTAALVDFGPADQLRFGAAFDALVPSREDAPQNAVKLDWMNSPVGPLLLGVSSTAVVALEFAALEHIETQVQRLHKQLNAPIARGDEEPLLQRLRSELIEYFGSRRRAFDVPISYAGSEFQQRVWTALRAIPYGQTCSYAAIARAVGDPNATRAVGMANGQNPIAIIVPCHRVVNASGELGGYGGGRWRKQLLLDLEQGQGRLF